MFNRYTMWSSDPSSLPHPCSKLAGNADMEGNVPATWCTAPLRKHLTRL